MARNNGVARETLTTKEDTNETRFVNANCKVQIEKCKLSRNIRRTGLAILTFAFCNFHFALLVRVLRAFRGENDICSYDREGSPWLAGIVFFPPTLTWKSHRSVGLSACRLSIATALLVWLSSPTAAMALLLRTGPCMFSDLRLPASPMRGI